MPIDRRPLGAPTSVWPLLKRVFAPAVIAAPLALGACAGGPGALDFASLGEKPQQVADATPAQPQTELQKATQYWGEQFAKAPGDAQVAINYTRNLKALGAKQQALTVIQQANAANPSHKVIASEYGRLALEMEQIAVAEKLLAQADDPVSPDWKVISARGTVLAKQGRYREAIPQFERALQIAPNQPAVLNNLALAHAMNGQAEKAEPILRQAAMDGNADPKVSQNLSLVLGLQGKHDDAKSIIVRNSTSEDQAEDSRYVREMVGNQPAWAQNTSANTAAISTGSTAQPAAAKSKSKGKATAAPQQPPQEDASALVQRLADGYTNTPSDAPVQLGPKR